jgi:hypothetical protein
MGGASSGGEDNQVSGYEAEITKQRKGTKKEINKDLNVGTYGERNIDPDRGKTVNQEIAEQNKKNRESRKGLIQKYAENNLLGKLSRSEWSRQKNIKSRKAYAEKIGLDTSLFTDEFMASQGFKDQLDGKGYADRFDPLQANDATKSGEENAYQAYLKSDGTAPKHDEFTSPGFNDGTPPDKIKPNGPTTAEIDQSTATTKSADETLLATNKKGRTSNILTSSKGLGENNLIIKRRKLG